MRGQAGSSWLGWAAPERRACRMSPQSSGRGTHQGEPASRGAVGGAVDQQVRQIAPNATGQGNGASGKNLAHESLEPGNGRRCTGTGTDGAGGRCTNPRNGAGLRLGGCRFESCRAYHINPRVRPLNRTLDAIERSRGASVQCSVQCPWSQPGTSRHNVARPGTGAEGPLRRESCRAYFAGRLRGGQGAGWGADCGARGGPGLPVVAVIR